MYIRFESRDVTEVCSQFTGMFTTAYDMLESPDIDPEDLRLLKKTLCWFERELPVPPAQKSYGHCVFWFKSESTEITNHAWFLIEILKRYDHDVRMIKSNKPGYIIYEDDHQVGAVPFRDTFA